MTGPSSGSRSPKRHVILGNPPNRRVRQFQAALVRTGQPPALEISYLDVLTGRRKFDELLAGDLILRIESPGEDFEVERHLIALGATCDALGDSQRIDRDAALALEFDVGRLRFSRQWYDGYRRFLTSLQDAIAGHPGLELYNTPDDILCMFDKPRCQQRLAAHNVPVAPFLEHVASYDVLCAEMKRRGWQRVFVKLAYGSSASGVIALHRHARGVRAVTSMEMDHPGREIRWYNNLKLRTYTDQPDVANLVNYVCREGAQVEQWLPKASIDGGTFDLRIVVIAGRACHVVVRKSTSPMTNLHLGNRRGNVAALKDRMGLADWNATLAFAERASRVFPNSLYVGVDLLLQPGFRKPTVLELNAFGDLLPGVEHQGRDTYETEILEQAKSARNEPVGCQPSAASAGR